ncbi:hypothetical protein MHU86_16721 [Fragilaria crotonensis]|nr:hypothetical protein MHU86_16721 [Fragilaria crotonensis]
MNELIEIAKQQPVRSIIRYSLVYLGNPIIFFLYLSAMANKESSNQYGKKILGIISVKMVDINVAWLNPALYVLITLPFYTLWIWLQVTLLTLACSSKCTFDAQIFYDHHTSVAACLWAIPGLYNILVWSTSGMEGNVMGLFFALPLLIATLAYIIMWIMALVASTRNPLDISHANPLIDSGGLV